MINNNVFLKRRKKLLKKLAKGAVAILFANAELERNGGNNYPFHQDSDFYYLTGFPEPDAVAVLSSEHYILFARDKDPLQETWTGYRVGSKGACSDYGADKAYSLAELDGEILELIQAAGTLYFNMNEPNSARIQNWLTQLKGKGRVGINPSTRVVDLAETVHEMRLIKDRVELKLIRKAADISSVAHIRAIEACCPSVMEYELEAELRYQYLKHGARDVAFPPIVAGGSSSCTMHYMANDKELKAGDLVLIDAGAEYQSYCGDITRTVPVSGEFTPAQREVYQAVLTVQESVIAMIKPGVVWNELEEMALKVTAEELTKLKIKGKASDYFIHHIGHWLGLDAHDVGLYKLRDGSWRTLQPGMVLTVEPGLYFPPNNTKVAAKWRGIGVRIEDDILVTKKGYEVLTAAVPKQVAEIELR